jgi:hypothetical protein
MQPPVRTTRTGDLASALAARAAIRSPHRNPPRLRAEHPAAAANGARQHTEAQGADLYPQGADPATPRADPDEAGQGRPLLPWMRKTIQENHEGGGRRRGERWGLPPPTLRPHGRPAAAQAAARGAAVHGGEWPRGALGSARVAPRGETQNIYSL